MGLSKRPYIVHFWPIVSEATLSIKASLALKKEGPKTIEDISEFIPGHPLQNIRLLAGRAFQLKIIGQDENRRHIFNRLYDSDSIGNFFLKIPVEKEWPPIKYLSVYETGTHPGIEINLGHFLPLQIRPCGKLVISDFDKTLVDTRYSTGKEVFYSLTRPLQYFPTVPKSVDLLKQFIAQDYSPFILSASPHFYEGPMRDWLYQNKIYSAPIFLKDYRQVLSFFEGVLRPKDLKIQGLYKLNHLLDILNMTGMPEKIALLGDNFESDPIIYLTFALCLRTNIEPWKLWNMIKTLESFQLSRRQDSVFLNKIFQLKNQQKRFFQVNQKLPEVAIFIRKKGQETGLELPLFFEEVFPLLTLYEGREDLSTVTKQNAGSEEKNIANRQV